MQNPLSFSWGGEYAKASRSISLTFVCLSSPSFVPASMPRDWSVAQRIKHGHEFLVKITHQDFGYDAMRWHDYLWDSGAGGYRWSRRSREKWARQVEAAISDPVWQEAIRELDRTATEPHPSPN
jgi:hypothetical protein